MRTNATITVYNRQYDKKTRLDTWRRTVIRGVHIYVDHKTSVGEAGLVGAEVYKIRIPAEMENADQYLPPEEYARLSNPAGYWTIRNDDHIVLGECMQEIERPADLEVVWMKHCKILSWSDNRRKTTRPHWRVEGA